MKGNNMHYIPFLSEKKDNRYEDIDCRNCPCFEGSTIYNKILIGTCKFNNCRKEEFDLGSNCAILLEAGKNRTCPVKYKDPIENFHFFQFMRIISNDLHNTSKDLTYKRENRQLSDEEENNYKDKLHKLVQLSILMEELFPEQYNLYKKITFEGYKLDETMTPYK